MVIEPVSPVGAAPRCHGERNHSSTLVILILGPMRPPVDAAAYDAGFPIRSRDSNDQLTAKHRHSLVRLP